MGASVCFFFQISHVKVLQYVYMHWCMHACIHPCTHAFMYVYMFALRTYVYMCVLIYGRGKQVGHFSPIAKYFAKLVRSKYQKYESEPG